MGLRHYCDMCGLTISGPFKKVECHGLNLASPTTQNFPYQAQLQAQQALQNAQLGVTLPSQNLVENYMADFHLNCYEAWWKRMKEIAAAADK